MKTWYFPSWCGDFRLVETKTGKAKLVIERPTAAEVAALNAFLKKAKRKGWTNVELLVGDGYRKAAKQQVMLDTTVAEAGEVLVDLVRPVKKATLTAVSSKNGKVEVAARDDADFSAFIDEKKGEKDAKAATVSRPTPSCPDCVPGSIEKAREVLLSFLTDEQHEDWAKHRAIIVLGGYSGNRYLIAHRHTPQAVKQTRICYDLDDRMVVHFHDWAVPPEEEVLAAKLILEHREDWLRNEATMLGVRGLSADDENVLMQRIVRYKNPFGDFFDGRPDAALVESFGRVVQGLVVPPLMRTELLDGIPRELDDPVFGGVVTMPDGSWLVLDTGFAASKGF